MNSDDEEREQDANEGEFVLDRRLLRQKRRLTSSSGKDEKKEVVKVKVDNGEKKYLDTIFGVKQAKINKNVDDTFILPMQPPAFSDLALSQALLKQTEYLISIRKKGVSHQIPSIGDELIIKQKDSDKIDIMLCGEEVKSSIKDKRAVVVAVTCSKIYIRRIRTKIHTVKNGVSKIEKNGLSIGGSMNDPEWCLVTKQEQKEQEPCRVLVGPFIIKLKYAKTISADLNETGLAKRNNKSSVSSITVRPAETIEIEGFNIHLHPTSLKKLLEMAKSQRNSPLSFDRKQTYAICAYNLMAPDNLKLLTRDSSQVIDAFILSGLVPIIDTILSFDQQDNSIQIRMFAAMKRTNESRVGFSSDGDLDRPLLFQYLECDPVTKKPFSIGRFAPYNPQWGFRYSESSKDDVKAAKPPVSYTCQDLVEMAMKPNHLVQRRIAGVDTKEFSKKCGLKANIELRDYQIESIKFMHDAETRSVFETFYKPLHPVNFINGKEIRQRHDCAFYSPYFDHMIGYPATFNFHVPGSVQHCLFSKGLWGIGDGDGDDDEKAEDEDEEEEEKEKEEQSKEEKKRNGENPKPDTKNSSKASGSKKRAPLSEKKKQEQETKRARAKALTLARQERKGDVVVRDKQAFDKEVEEQRKRIKNLSEKVKQDRYPSRNFIPRISGGMIADEQRIGKTIQILALVNLTKAENKGKPAQTLFVTNTSVIGQCLNDLRTHSAAKLTICIAYGKQLKSLTKEKLQNADIVLTTYKIIGSCALADPLSFVNGLVNTKYNKLSNEGGEGKTKGRGSSRIAVPLLVKCKWKRLVLDESHALESTSTSKHRGIMNLSFDSCWDMSGTPINNGNLQSLQGQLAFFGIPGFQPGHGYFAKIKKYLPAEKDTKGKAYTVNTISVSPLFCWFRKRSIRHVKSQAYNGRAELAKPTERTLIVTGIKLPDQEQEIYNLLEKQSKLVAGQYANTRCLFFEQAENVAIKLRLLRKQLHLLRQACSFYKVNVNELKECISILEAILDADRRREEAKSNRNSNPNQGLGDDEQDKTVNVTIEQLDTINQIASVLSRYYKHGDECCICKSEEMQSPCQTKCEHVFCEDCIKSWISRKKTCPLCNKKVQ